MYIHKDRYKEGYPLLSVWDAHYLQSLEDAPPNEQYSEILTVLIPNHSTPALLLFFPLSPVPYSILANCINCQRYWIKSFITYTKTFCPVRCVQLQCNLECNFTGCCLTCRGAIWRENYTGFLPMMLWGNIPASMFPPQKMLSVLFVCFTSVYTGTLKINEHKEISRTQNCE